MMSKSRTIVSLAATAVVSFALAASAHARGPQGPVPGKPGDANIVEIALAVNADNGEFSTLLTAATCDFFEGAVVDLLSGSDFYTLFAPVDAAFAKLGLDATNICGAFETQPTVLLNILTYHVTEGRRFSNSVFNRNAVKSVEMLNGGFIVTNPNLTINDNAGQTIGVVAPLVNINASNGVIHVIDTVLLP
jgi:uncharacterized surface protein with fasciclin (FAS1) repeats